MIRSDRSPAEIFVGVFVGAIKLMGWPREHVQEVVGPFRAVRRRDPDDPETCEVADLMIEDLAVYAKAHEDGLFTRSALARHRLAIAAAELGDALAALEATKTEVSS